MNFSETEEGKKAFGRVVKGNHPEIHSGHISLALDEGFKAGQESVMGIKDQTLYFKQLIEREQKKARQEALEELRKYALRYDTNITIKEVKQFEEDLKKKEVK